MTRVTDASELGARLGVIHARIAGAVERAGRAPDSVRLVAVSKNKPAADIRAAYAAGQRDFGENYVQELLEKTAALADLVEIRWHVIGRLQRNKARDVARIAALVHTVDRAELARELARRATAAGRRLEILVEVNVAGEATKGGCAPGELAGLLDELAGMPGIEARGLMTIAPDVDDPEAVRPVFAALRELAAKHRLRELSMGMSHDFEIAIEEGATLVRVGTAIFGARSAPGQ